MMTDRPNNAITEDIVRIRDTYELTRSDRTQSEIEIQTNKIPVKITVRRPDGSWEESLWVSCPAS